MELSRAKKAAAIAVEIILLLTFVLLAVSELMSKKTGEAEEVYYSYNSRGSIDYRVYLKPNIMFGEEYLEKGRYYVLKYIDRIDVEFEYDYESDTAARLEAEYSVAAYLQGLYGKDNELLWSKEIPLIAEETKTVEGRELSVSHSLSLDLNDYSRTAESIILDSEVNSPVVLRVVFNVSTAAATKNGIVRDEKSPNLIIPIGSSVFKIEGEPVVTADRSFSETVKYPIPVNRTRVIVLFGASSVLGLLAVLTARIKEAPSPDSFDKEVARIFKEYSERLAGLERTISYHFSESIPVRSIEDMVKIADEVGQPIFYYKADSGEERKIEFFVFDNMRTYYMVIFGDIRA